MKKIDSFVNLYSISKTLRFGLIPQGNTEENFKNMLILENDKQRAEDIQEVEDYMNDYHKNFIEERLKDFKLNNVSEYAELYWDKGASDKDIKKLAQDMRKKISENWKAGEKGEYQKLFKQDMVKELLPNFLTDEKEKETVKRFDKDTMAFTQFYKNKENMYKSDGNAGEIAYRIVDENLPRFLDNCKAAEKAFEVLSKEDLLQLEEVVLTKFHIDLYDIKEPESFNDVLTQSGIDVYNQIIGGFSTENNVKIKGLNELINLYRQQTKKKIPLLKPLFKQILSEKSTISFIPAQFENDQEVLDAVKNFYNETEGSIDRLSAMLGNLTNYQIDGIYVKKNDVNRISKDVFNSWNYIREGLEAEYDKEKRKRRIKNEEKYLTDKEKYFDKIESYSLEQLQNAAKEVESEEIFPTIVEYIGKKANELAEAVKKTYGDAGVLLKQPYPSDKKLIASDEDIALVKKFLDAVKNFQRFAALVAGTGKEKNRHGIFYSEYQPLYEQLNTITSLYDKVRNYLTQKPYSKDKIRLTFGNSQFMKSWTQNKEKDYSAVLFRKQNGLYYLGIVDNDSKSLLNKKKKIWTEPINAEDSIEKMVLLQAGKVEKSTQNLMFIDGKIKKVNCRKEKTGLHEGENLKLEEEKNKNLPQEINRIRRERTYLRSSENFLEEDLIKYIDFYKKCVIAYYNKFKFVFKPSKDYSDFTDFTDDIKRQAYQIYFFETSEKFVNELVEDGKLYLFQIYTKDFSSHSKGTPNLHTLYFNTIFEPENLKNIMFALNGGAQMFYRKASINKNDTAIHPANQPILNKNPLGGKKESVFNYDLIKNKRFTERQFMLHVPITLNYQATTAENKYKIDECNLKVSQALRDCDNNYIIGIDRGERNLLYISVIDGSGHIVEQYSMNTIKNEYNGNEYETNYHSLLDDKEKQRDKAKKDWQSIENIKELKSGYLSQAVHKICELVEKYDAVIAMEYLNEGFKNKRAKVEKQVYQKFEKMLIDKLQYMADKKKPLAEKGSIMKAYQLTANVESFTKKEKKNGFINGFIIYIPAWMTSKIDPTTGFVSLIYPKYTNITASQNFFGLFDDIRYDRDKDEFVFELDYEKFPGCIVDWKKKWTLTTYGERILRKRNKNNQYESKEIVLTEEFKKLFDEFDIDYNTNTDLKETIISQQTKNFHKKLMELTALMLQMRNSVSGNDVDYLISPVVNKYGCHFDSRECGDYDCTFPNNADANGAYHIAQKARLAIQNMKQGEKNEIKTKISKKEWLEYMQSMCE